MEPVRITKNKTKLWMEYGQNIFNHLSSISDTIDKNSMILKRRT